MSEQNNENTRSQAELTYARRRKVRINGRFLLILVIITALLGGGTYALHHSQMKEIRNSLLTLSTEAEEAGKLKEAAQYLQQYVRFRPEDYDAKLRLANLLEKFSQSPRNLVQVHSILEDILRNDFERDDVAEIRLRVVKLSLRIGRFQTALDHLKNLREEAPKSSPAELASLEARAHTGLKDYATAILWYLEAIKHSPETVDYYVSLATLIRFQPKAVPYRDRLYEKPDDKNKPDDKKLSKSLVAVFPERLKDEKQPGVKKDDEDETNEPHKGPATVGDLTDEAKRQILDGIYAELVKAGKPPHEALAARSSYFLQRGEKGDVALARKDVDEALKTAPRDPDVLQQACYVVLAQSTDVLLVRATNEEEVEQKKKRFRALLALAENFAQRGLESKAPANLRFHATLARIAGNREIAVDGNAAREAQRKLSEKHIDDGLENLTAYRKSEKPTTIEDVLRLNRIERQLRQMKIEMLLGRMTNSNGEIDEKVAEKVEKQRTRLQTLGAGESRLALIQARVLLMQREWTKALEMLVAARPRLLLLESPNQRRQADSLISLCHRQLNNAPGAVQALLNGLEVDPNWHSGRLAVAGMLAEQGQFDEARRLYNTLLSKRYSPAVLPSLRLQVREMARKPAAQRDLSAVYKNLETAEKSGRDRAMISLLRIDAWSIDRRIPKKERFAKITQELKTSLKDHPKNALLHVAAARFAALRPDRDKKQRIADAREMLNNSRSAVDNPHVIDLARAELYGRLSKEAALKELKALEKVAESYRGTKKQTLLEAVAASYARAGLSDKHFALKQKLTKHSPNDLDARLDAALLALQRGNKNAFNAQLSEIRRIEGLDGPWSNFVEAMGIVYDVFTRLRKERGKLKDLSEEERLKAAPGIKEDLEAELHRAQRLLTRTTRLRPLWPQPVRELGRVVAILGDSDEAYRQYRKAIDLGDRSSRAFTYAVQYLYRKQRFDEADQLIKMAGGVAAPLLSPTRLNLSDRQQSLPELAIQVAAARGEFEKASRFLEGDSKDYRRKIMLALLKFTEHRQLSEADRKSEKGRKLLEDARKLHEEAVALAGDSPRSWLFLVAHFARNDQPKEAEAAIQRAMKKLKEDDKWLTAARCYVILGKHEEAEKHYLEAVRRKPKDASLRLDVVRYLAARGEWGKADLHLKTVLGGGTDATKSQLAVARHTRIIGTSKGGNYADKAKALKLLQPLEESSLPDLYTRVAILRESALLDDRKALIKVLELIDRKRKLTPDQKFQLARLYEKVGQWNDAKQVLQELLKSNPQNTIWRSWYAVEILANEADGATASDKKQAIEKARQQFVKLRQDDPVSLSTAMTEARLLVAEGGKQDEASKVLTDAVNRFIRIGGKLKRADRTRLLLVARLAERLSLSKAAEHMIREYVRLSSNPRSRLVLAQFLGRDEKYTEALKICAELAKDPKALDQCAVSAVRIVMTGTPDRTHFATVEAIVKAAIKAKPESTGVAMIYAEYLTAAGRLKEAEAEYRKFLKEKPRNVALLNNLAWLLAIQDRDLPDALELIQRAIEIAGPHPQLLDTRSMVFTRMGNTQQAIADLEQATSQPSDSSFYLHLAQAYSAAGNKDKAEEAMNEAIDQGLSLRRLHRLEHDGWYDMLKKTGVTP